MKTLRDTLETSPYPLLVATEWHAIDLVDEWLHRGEDVNQCESSDGLTALHMAVMEGYLDIAKILTQFGANANAVSVDGNTPLHLAAERGELEMVQLLLGAGADCNQRDFRHRTAENLARKHGHGMVAETLRTASRQRATVR